MTASIDEVKSFLRKTHNKVYYNDPISVGRSLKIVYNTAQRNEAVETAIALKKKFPNNVVRTLTPTEMVRSGYSVRIWTT